MADELLEKARDIFEGQIDFEGQKVTDLLSTVLLVITGALSFLVGFALQDIKLALYILLAGSALTFVLVVPPWPFYNKHPIQWLQPAGSGATGHDVIVDGKVLE